MPERSSQVQRHRRPLGAGSEATITVAQHLATYTGRRETAGQAIIDLRSKRRVKASVELTKLLGWTIVSTINLQGPKRLRTIKRDAELTAAYSRGIADGTDTGIDVGHKDGVDVGVQVGRFLGRLETLKALEEVLRAQRGHQTDPHDQLRQPRTSSGLRVV